MLNEPAKKLGQALVAAKVLTQQQLAKALAEAAQPNSPSLVVSLLDSGLLSFKIFEKFVAKSMQI